MRVGRTGVLNPLAELEPVQVGGVTVSSATLHNEDDIRRKDIRVGDLVVVQRAGDVIPQVVGPAGAHEPGTKPWRMPKRCPLCGAEIVRPEGEVMHRCPNRACPSRGLETLYHWVGPAMDIENVGGSTIKKLWDEGIVRSLPDLYRLTAEQLGELDGFAEISATRAYDSIQRSNEQPFSRVLFGLNIPKVGWVIARSLALPLPLRRRRSPRDARAARGGRGHRARARRAHRGMVRRSRRTSRLIGELRELGLQLALAEDERPPEGRLAGSQYVITGTLEGWTREEAKAALEGFGAKVSDSVSKKTTGVVVGESPGSKAQKAEKLGVPVLSEVDLRELLGTQLEPSRSDPGRRGPSSTGRAEPLWRIAKTYRSPTSPARAEALFVVPVFACTRPRVGRVASRFRSVPDMPATARDATKTRPMVGSVAPARRMRDERRDGGPVVAREARPVRDAHAAERNRRIGERRADDSRSRCGRGRLCDGGAELLAGSSPRRSCRSRRSCDARRSRAVRRGRRRSARSSPARGERPSARRTSMPRCWSAAVNARAAATAEPFAPIR